jgi:hypothetical protein
VPNPCAFFSLVLIILVSSGCAHHEVTSVDLGPSFCNRNNQYYRLFNCKEQSKIIECRFEESSFDIIRLKRTSVNFEVTFDEKCVLTDKKINEMSTEYHMIPFEDIPQSISLFLYDSYKFLEKYLVPQIPLNP